MHNIFTESDLSLSCLHVSCLLSHHKMIVIFVSLSLFDILSRLSSSRHWCSVLILTSSDDVTMTVRPCPPSSRTVRRNCRAMGGRGGKEGSWCSGISCSCTFETFTCKILLIRRKLYSIKTLLIMTSSFLSHRCFISFWIEYNME